LEQAKAALTLAAERMKWYYNKKCHDLAKQLSHYLYFFSFSFLFLLDLQLQDGAWESIT